MPSIAPFKVEPCGPRKLERLFPGLRDRGRRVAETLDPPREIGGDQALVFHDQYFFLEIFARLHRLVPCAGCSMGLRRKIAQASELL